MRLTLPCATIEPVLRAMAQVARRASPAMPVLAGVLVEAKPDAVRLTATNGVLALQTTVARPDASEPFEPGATVVGADTLHQLVRTLAGDVTLAADEQAAEVRFAGGEARLAVASPEEFPSPHFARTAFELPSSVLRLAMDRVAYAAGDEGNSPILGGVHMTAGPDGVRFLATDRTQVAALRAPDVQTSGGEVVLPADFLATLARACDADTVRLGWDEHALTAVWKSTRLASLRLDGSYPDVEALMPPSYPVMARLDASRLANALRRAALTGAAYVAITVGPDQLTLTSAGPAGSHAETVPAQTSGELAANYQPALLLSALSRLPGPNVLLEAVNATSIMRIRSDDSGYAAVMPIVTDTPSASAREEDGT